METKQITEAQRNHLATLLAARNNAENAARSFVDYLYVEYGLTMEDGWTRVDARLGFVREAPVLDTEADST